MPSKIKSPLPEISFIESRALSKARPKERVMPILSISSLEQDPTAQSETHSSIALLSFALRFGVKSFESLTPSGKEEEKESSLHTPTYAGPATHPLPTSSAPSTKSKDLKPSSSRHREGSFISPAHSPDIFIDGRRVSNIAPSVYRPPHQPYHSHHI